METHVAAVKDIEELYKTGIEMSTNIAAPGYALTKMSTSLLDEYVQIQIMNALGPYSIVRLRGYNSGGMFILPNDKIIRKSWPSQIELFKPSLDKHYPDRWHYEEPYLYIYFPELKLTNSLDMEHTIYDLVVRLEFDTNSVASNIAGKRYSFTKKELAIGYVHSHLPGIDWDEDDNGSTFEYFCTGGASPFNKLLASAGEWCTAKKFEVILLQLEEYLKWESQEGRPHISMTELSEGGGSDGFTTNNDGPTIHRMAIYALELLKNAVESPVVKLLPKRQYIIDPSLDPNWFYENIEKPLIDKFNPPYLITWSLLRQMYVEDIDAAGQDLPEVSRSIDEVLIDKFDINRRFIEEGTPQEVGTLVKRFSVNNIIQVVNTANRYLMNGFMTPKKKENEQGASITA